MNTLKLNDKQKSGLIPYYKMARNSAIVSGVFSIVVLIIFSVNFIQFKKSDPINSKQLKILIEKVHRVQDNEELKETIRHYDLLVRKAHFTSLSFQKFGVYLLLGGILLHLISLKIMFELKRNVLVPSFENVNKDFFKKISAFQISIISGSFLFFIFAIIFSEVFTPSGKKNIPSPKSQDSILSGKKYAAEMDMKNNWPSFRGYGGLGISYSKNMPVSWDIKSGKNILWKFKVPKPGFNSPVIWKENIFLSGADNDSREVYCVNLLDGSLKWSIKINVSHLIPDTTEDTGLAAPSLITNGRFVGAIFGTGELMVCDFQGKILWQKKLETPDNHYGHSSSLMSYNNSLFVQYDTSKSGKLYSFNVFTGEINFEIERKVDTSWTSPILVGKGTKKQLILTATPFITAYDPITGEQLWQMQDVVGGEIGPSPAFFNDKLYPVNIYSVLACIDIKKQKVIWEYDENLPDASSPVVKNKFLILPSNNGFVSCLNSQTGELFWEHEFENGFYSSPVICENNVYLIDKKGVVHIFKLSEQFESISDTPVGESCVSTPSFIGNKLIIRGYENLYCIGEK